MSKKNENINEEVKNAEETAEDIKDTETKEEASKETEETKEAAADDKIAGLEAVSEEEKDSAFVKGIEQIYKQFVTVMEDVGVTPMDAQGKEFDANLHNAVMHVEDDEFGENIVAEELQKGYMYKENVLRHSMVKVAN